MCIYIFMHGIVRIEIYSYNKEVNTLYTVVAFPSHIPPKCERLENPKMSIVYHDAPIQVKVYVTLYPWTNVRTIQQCHT